MGRTLSKVGLISAISIVGEKLIVGSSKLVSELHELEEKVDALPFFIAPGCKELGLVHLDLVDRGFGEIQGSIITLLRLVRFGEITLEDGKASTAGSEGLVFLVDGDVVHRAIAFLALVFFESEGLQSEEQLEWGLRRLGEAEGDVAVGVSLFADLEGADERLVVERRAVALAEFLDLVPKGGRVTRHHRAKGEEDRGVIVAVSNTWEGHIWCGWVTGFSTSENII